MGKASHLLWDLTAPGASLAVPGPLSAPARATQTQFLIKHSFKTICPAAPASFPELLPGWQLLLGSSQLLIREQALMLPKPMLRYLHHILPHSKRLPQGPPSLRDSAFPLLFPPPHTRSSVLCKPGWDAAISRAHFCSLMLEPSLNICTCPHHTSCCSPFSNSLEWLERVYIKKSMLEVLSKQLLTCTFCSLLSRSLPCSGAGCSQAQCGLKLQSRTF